MAVLGSTMDGTYEPVQEICAFLDEYQEDTGIDIPVHVDAASGGFIAPFIQPGIVWDFQLERVVSIQTSGHKFGLVYPGVGWVLWREKEYLPEDLVFHVNYLGGDMPTFALNFSRPGAQVVLQYFQFLRLGQEGYRLVQQTCQDVAVHISQTLGAMPEFDVIADGRELPGRDVRRRARAVTKYTGYDVSRKLREFGWLVPAYTMPPNREDLVVLRVVVRNGFSHDMAELFLRDLRIAIDWLDNLEGPLPARGAAQQLPPLAEPPCTPWSAPAAGRCFYRAPRTPNRPVDKQLRRRPGLSAVAARFGSWRGTSFGEDRAALFAAAPVLRRVLAR